jgi:ABC-type lipoprotein release transport system permease subunit
MMNILMKGIDPQQKILALPADLLTDTFEFYAVIGKRMAQASNLKKGDQVLVRWRDVNGTFDARFFTIAGVFDCNVPTVDNNILWVSLNKLQQITGLPNEATLFAVNDSYQENFVKNWLYKDTKFLLADMDRIIQGKKGGGVVLYGLLLAIALLAIFDTQVLSIFRRQREIGTYIALGMTRAQVVQLFTIEGSAYSLLAIMLGVVYGAPLLALISKAGIPMPQASDKMGLSIAEKIIPAYSLGLIVTTIVLVIISTTIVSYLPARRISGIKPTDALKGKLQ